MPHVHNGLHASTALQAAYAFALGERQGEFSGLERAGETLTPTIDLWGRPEWAYLRGEELRAGTLALAAGGAGTFVEVQIFNPADSGVLWVTTGIRPNAAVFLLLELDATNVLATNDLGIAPRDSRLLGSSIVRRRGGNAGVVAIANRWFIPANELDPTRWVVAPGTVLRMQATIANTAAGVWFSGYQRRALPGELE